LDEDDNRPENASVDEATDRHSHSAERAWKKAKLDLLSKHRYPHLVKVCYRDLSKAS